MQPILSELVPSDKYKLQPHRAACEAAVVSWWVSHGRRRERPHTSPRPARTETEKPDDCAG
eukprot:703768-Prorocentrum_minimum.AAC.2